MVAVSADARKLIQIAAALAATVIAVAASKGAAQAGQAASHMLVIPASDGYDFDDCLGAAKACGRTIADAWCEAHGMSASVSFGRADDVTASIPKSATDKTAATPIKLQPGSFVVNCRD